MVTNKLKKNPITASIGYTFANIFIKGVSFVTLPIFARLLSTSEYGQYSMFITYESILTVAVSLCIYSSLNIAKATIKDKLDDYLSSVLLIPILNTLFLLFVSFFVSYKAREIDFLGLSGYMYPLLVLYSFGTAVLSFFNIRASIDYSYLKYLLISILNTILNISLSLILIFLVFPSNAIKGRIFGATAAIFLVALSIVFYFFKRRRPQVNLAYWKFAISFSSPLVIHGFSQLLLSEFGKIAIQTYYGSEIVGIYGFALTISQIPNVIVTSLSTVWTPWFYENYSESKYADINYISQKCIKLFSIGFISCVCLLPEVIKIMAPQEYWASIEIIVPVVMIYYIIFLYNIIVQVEYYHKKTKIIGMVTMLAAICNVIFDLIAAKYIGYRAVPYVAVVSYVLYLIFHMSVVKRIDCHNSFNFRNIIFTATLSICFMMALNCFCDSLLIRILISIIFVISVYIPDRKGINGFLKSILNKLSLGEK